MPRPWAIDDFDKVLQLLVDQRHKKALVFVDNAGSDVILGASSPLTEHLI